MNIELPGALKTVKKEELSSYHLTNMKYIPHSEKEEEF